MYYLMDWPAKPAQWTSAVLKFLKRFERSAAVEQFKRFVPALGGRTETASPLSKLEFRALDVAAPDIDGSANWKDGRLMRISETAVTPAEFYGKSTRGLHVYVHGLTIDVAAGAHAYRRLVDAQEMIGAHDVIERFHFEHYMLQPGGFARHAWRESQAVMTLVAAQEAQTNVLIDVDPITQAKAQHAGVEIM